MSARQRSAWLLTAVFICSLPAVTTRIYASDEIQYFAYLRSLWFDHDVSFENEYQHFYDSGIARTPGFHETFLERHTETGRRINFGTIGSALLWAPFYAVADAVVGRRNDEPAAEPGFSRPYIAAVAYASAVYGFLAVVISAIVVARITGLGAWPAWLVWAGTPLAFYMYVAPPMSHACSAFAVSAFLLAWLHVRTSWSARGLMVLGALAALMAMVREQDAFFVVGPLLDFARSWLSAAAPPTRRRWLVNGAAGVAAGLVAYLPQALAYVALNGYVGPSRLVARKMSWTAPHFAQVLFSPAHGFFFWTPLALLACVGLVLAVSRPLPVQRQAQWLAACMLVMLFAQVYVAGSVESWTVAGAFGQRRFVAVTPLLAVGLALLWQRTGRGRYNRGLVMTILVLTVWWNLGLIVQFGAGLMNRQFLEPRRNAHVNFAVLPRLLPSLGYRYFFDRPSFYQTTLP